FGHERGAFTGAHRAHAGLVREAQVGTLFLDEIADLSSAAQAKLLRALEQREVRAVGASRAHHVDFRLVSATHRMLGVLVQRGEFRADLYARLLGAVVRLPALRERREDILPLFLRFARGADGTSPRLSVGLVEALCIHDWPMNVRQLRAIAERMTILHGSHAEWRRRHLREAAPELDGSCVPPPDSAGAARLRPSSPARATRRGSTAPPLASESLDAGLAKDQVLARLRESRGNVTRAARLLGVSKQTVYRMIKAEGIDVEPFRTPGRGR
ncbi:MAG TPA: sigma 54-interacting transcriptional regulator, partial [Polyangiaceae bacterium]|nr:sigma 54-interacting transcriptional regulator [Polyangiaceae bacterium]